MLQQYNIARIALISAIAGIAFLFALTTAFESAQANISELNEQMAGGSVLLKGRVDSAWSSKGTLFFQLNDGTGKMQAVIFNPSEEQKQVIAKNAFVAVTGKVQVYKNALEIIVAKVEAW